MVRVFEAFAGYGSQSIALELLALAFPNFQFDTVGISEIDKNAIKAYRTLHGNIIPNHGDITKIDWTQTADFDLLTYSFPCQDISSAGKQRGFTEGSGTRSSCLWACADAIETKHPQFLLMENVKALATQKKFSDDFRRWREWLIKHGYTTMPSSTQRTTACRRTVSACSWCRSSANILRSISRLPLN